MKNNHEFFTRMSNVSDILVKLYTRGVVPAQAFDRINGQGTEEKKAGIRKKNIVKIY